MGHLFSRSPFKLDYELCVLLGHFDIALNFGLKFGLTFSLTFRQTFSWNLQLKTSSIFKLQINWKYLYRSERSELRCADRSVRFDCTLGKSLCFWIFRLQTLNPRERESECFPVRGLASKLSFSIQPSRPFCCIHTSFPFRFVDTNGGGGHKSLIRSDCKNEVSSTLLIIFKFCSLRTVSIKRKLSRTGLDVFLFEISLALERFVGFRINFFLYLFSSLCVLNLGGWTNAFDPSIESTGGTNQSA